MLYRVPEDMFPSAAQALINGGRAVKLEEEKEPKALDKIVRTASKVFQGAKTAARFSVPYGPQNSSYYQKR